MKRFEMSMMVPSSLVLLAGVGLLVTGCSLYRPASRSETILSSSALADPDPGQPATVRVGGDLEATVNLRNGEFESGGCRITTPLPEGYPPPTPPGAIEIKRYPLVRRAAISGTMMPDWGMNFAFFPLFNHIKRHEIAMTSPVEVNYHGLGDDGAGRPESWTMSFLYRTPELAAAGVDPEDERILVEDVPPVTVAAIGVRGPYRMKLVNRGLARLHDWLAQQSEWEEAGEPRALFYNGPESSASNKWGEVQIPIRRR